MTKLAAVLAFILAFIVILSDPTAAATGPTNEAPVNISMRSWWAARATWQREEAQKQGERTLTDDQLTALAWRVEGATSETIRETAKDNETWEEITHFARRSGTIPDGKLETLRKQMIMSGFAEVELGADTLLDWVWGKTDGHPFQQQNVRVKSNQRAYRFDLGDGYVIYLLAKCFNFTMARRLAETITTEVPLTAGPPPTKKIECRDKKMKRVKPGVTETFEVAIEPLEAACSQLSWWAQDGDPENAEGTTSFTTMWPEGTNPGPKQIVVTCDTIYDTCWRNIFADEQDQKPPGGGGLCKVPLVGWIVCWCVPDKKSEFWHPLICAVPLGFLARDDDHERPLPPEPEKTGGAGPQGNDI